MSYHIQLHPLAEDEIQESYEWYEERSQGLGKRFLTAIQKKFDHLCANPELYSNKTGKYRSTTTDHFPFTIIYEIEVKQNTIFVSYVFHTKRNPKLKYKR